MIHHTCDRCKRAIDPEDELRYSVHMEIRAVFGNGDACMDCGQDDHLLELDEILERLEDAENQDVCEDVYQRRRFDLCPDCYQQFIRNPVGREVPLTIGFSAN